MLWPQRLCNDHPFREPCPDRILDDIGGAFGMGAVGGGIWHLCKGLYNSPKGSRMRGGVDVCRGVCVMMSIVVVSRTVLR